MNTYQHNFELPKGKSYIVPAIILGVLFALAPFCFFNFMPEYILTNSSDIVHPGESFFIVFNRYFFTYGNVAQKIAASFYWIISCANIIISVTIGWYVMRIIFVIIDYKQWFANYLSEHSKIINSCKIVPKNKKIAMVVATCNDFSPNTIMQTARQTYKNMDVWVSDDSSKKEVIDAIDKFCAKHNYHVLHRDPAHKKAHPTKIGNIFYFMEKVGNKYDFIFENDSSSIITSTFVENGLRYFHSPILDHSRDGAIVTNGGFYGAKNILSFLAGRAFMFTEATCATGGSVQLTGSPTSLNGWACLYKTSALMSIDLAKVECPICDSARGMFLTLNNYVTYMDPFDFAAKLGPQHVEALKAQRLKWSGGDAFVFRNGLSRSKFPTIRQRLHITCQSFSINVMLPATIISLFINAIILSILNFLYFNLTATVCLTAFFIVLFIPVIILLFAKKAPILPLIWTILGAIAELGFIYQKIYQIVWKGFILKTWSSSAVTVKTTQALTTKQKWRMSLSSIITIMFALTLCLLLTFLIPESKLQRLLIWLNIFTVLITPSFIYLVYIWIGSIKIKQGYDSDAVNYYFWLKDFRLKYVKKSEIWKSQHPNNI